MASLKEIRQAGFECGGQAGSWVIDGNTDVLTAQRWLDGFEDGDPEIMDCQPAPLSGEWAGESIAELSREYGFDLSVDVVADAFEEAYSDGFWSEVQRAARAVVGEVTA